MEAQFEIRYLDIRWFNQKTVIHITESFIPLKINLDDVDDCFFCETTIYPKIDTMKQSYLGFRYLDDAIKSIPYINNQDLSKIKLKKTIDINTKKTWWIIADEWHKGHKNYINKHNTAGTISLVLNKQPCKVLIQVSDDEIDVLEAYLKDFKSDLWLLAFDDKSYITSDIKPNKIGGINDKTINAFGNLIHHAQKILDNPKGELREVLALKSFKKVKPVARTFMELTTKSDKRFLTSRTTQQTFNVPENQYILYVLQRCYRILKQLDIVSDKKTHHYKNQLEKLEERLTKLTDYRKINEQLARKDLQRLQNDYDNNNLDWLNQNLQSDFNKCCPVNNSNTPKQWYVKIQNPTWNNDGYFIGIKSHIDKDWFYKNEEFQYVYLKFEDKNKYDALFKNGFEYEVQGDIEHKKYKNKKGNDYSLITLHHLTEIKIIGGDTIEKLKEKILDNKKEIADLEKNNWIKLLNNKELNEQNREKTSIKKQQKYYQTLEQNTSKANKSLSPMLPKLKKIIEYLKKLKIKPLATFPNSITFVHNPHYQGVYAGYKIIRDVTHLNDEDLLLSLEEFDKIGLVNMPLLYERWCLLQIIRVLVENYHYVPTQNWKHKLLKIIQTRNHSESIEFENEFLKRKINLYYENILKNNKRPDFILDVQYDKKPKEKTAYSAYDYHTTYEDENKIQEKRFIIDAKFYTADVIKSKGGISAIHHNLYIEKNYGADNTNSVFILQPSNKNVITEIVSPQEWGTHSYYGEIKMFDWERISVFKEHKKRYDFHQYGAICLNPIHKYSFLDDLQRLIGMFLQYGIEDNNTALKENSEKNKKDDTEAYNFCIACGSHDLRIVPQPIRYKCNLCKNMTESAYCQKCGSNDLEPVSKYSVWYECNDCKHFTTYNHCYQCRTRLIKNGDYWTYHSHMPIQPLNIKCPCCEALL